MPIRHVVIFKFKPDAQEAIASAKAALLALQGKIDGLTSMTFGETFTTDRANGYTHCLVSDHGSKEALQAYAEHADHQAIITTHIRPNLEAPPMALDFEY
eukprot:CAMPEP_0184306266 /NCGR_PEP_ID=MMETSP1049-20130417/15307_1 /TAXON_ID=77928 /ORGANISM="Proteomonas sulcata, Strain CCMP704" /LENGTH=99 /DNA_ID=CAMNT_0026618487 /DNA_START=33 /DNA_END=332 /DNA_ORIENTATION=+